MRHLAVPLLLCAMATPASACPGPVLPAFIVYLVFAGPFWLVALALFGLFPKRVRGTARWSALLLMLFVSAFGPLDVGSFEMFVAIAAMPIVVPILFAAFADRGPRSWDDQPEGCSKSTAPRPRRPGYAPELVALTGARIPRPDPAIRVVAQGNGDEGRCPVCSTPATGSILACTRCSTPHHTDCFRYNGDCAVYACVPAR